MMQPNQKIVPSTSLKTMNQNINTVNMPPKAGKNGGEFMIP
jgi:hypothetical protein